MSGLQTYLIGLFLVVLFASPAAGGCPGGSDALQARWSDLVQRLGNPVGAGEAIYRELSSRYCEPHRAYHTLAHLEHALAELDSARELAADVEAVELALWFHDVVYDLGSRTNEEDSARLAERAALDLGMGEPRSARVAELVLVTKHGSVPDDVDGRLVVDIDLSILGQPPARFDRYETEIRKEYSPVIEERGVAAFNAGRAGILQRFLDRPAIYSTKFFADRYETAARANLERSIEQLEDPSWTEPDDDRHNRPNS